MVSLRLAILVAVSSLLLAAGARSARAEEEAVPTGRLPADVRATRLALTLTVDPRRPTFTGEGDVELELTRARRTLWLHGRGLTVTRATALLPDGKTVRASYRQVDATGVARVDLPSLVGPGRVTLHLAWSARYDEGLVGLYRVSVGDQWYVYSQLESTYARRVFPCIDEPGAKVPISITLMVPPRLVAVSNMPVRLARSDGKGQTIVFEETPPLSPYLVAIAVGKLAIVEAPPIAPSTVRPRALPLRGVTTPGHEAELAFSLAETPAIVEHLERYFGIAYPYAKLDLIAVPDFAAGAMENAGAITFRDTYLLFDAEGGSVEQRTGIVATLVHELAHQWFGDLVTMAWWDDTWLNEAFATWMEAHISDELHPELGGALDLVASAQGTMTEDELVSARSVAQPIASDHDIQNAFDGITYQKGAAVLVMFERWMGADALRAGVRAHLTAHAGGTATTTDLLAAFDRAAGRDVATAFRTFIDQPGVPLVAAEVKCEASGARLLLRQSRSLPLGSTGSRAARWRIPVCARWSTAGKPEEACTLLVEETGSLALGAGCPSWVLPNAGGAGYYRFSLPARDLERLRTVAGGWPDLDERERSAVAHSVDAGLSSGAIDAETALGSLAPFALDDEVGVAQVATGMLTFARDHVMAPSERALVEEKGRALFAPSLARLGWEPSASDSPSRLKLRASVIGFLALEARDPAVRAEALARGRRYLALVAAAHGRRPRQRALAPELTGVALAVMAQEGGVAGLDSIARVLRRSDDPWLRGELLGALGSVETAAQARRTIAIATGPGLRVEERVDPLLALAAEAQTRDLLWEWWKPRADRLAASLSEDARGHVSSVAAAFCSEARAVEVERFFAGRVATLPGGPRNLAKVVEGIGLCAALVAAQGEGMRRFFRAR